MTSRFGWIDFAEDDRQQMLEVVRMFHEQDTRDELGIGIVRDAFSDFFFPGTSTIQTRAKYMLFIPWIYLDLEKRCIEYPDIIDRARKSEIKLINALCSSKSQDGVIGKDAREKLQRLPSVIYWSGLAKWGIRLFNGSQEQYHRYFSRFAGKNQQPKYSSDDNDVSRMDGWKSWHEGIPSAPDGFLEKSDLNLTKEQALYLQERILSNHSASLLSILACQSEIVDSDFIWNNPTAKKLPANLSQEVYHARNFSETIYGAVLLYNLMLSEACQNKEWSKRYAGRIKDWIKAMGERESELKKWIENGEFWSSQALTVMDVLSSRSLKPAKTFVETWWSLVFRSDRVDVIMKDKDIRRLIYNREVDLKRARARLENPRALETWMGAAGDSQLDFRWGITKKIITDIIVGING